MTEAEALADARSDSGPWSPIYLRPDPKARGWKAAAGWYPFDSRELRADTSVRYTKRECQTRCDHLNARAEGAK